MAEQVRSYTLAIPASTPNTVPVVLDLALPPLRVDAIQVIVPPGPSGLVGWAVLNSGVRVIPYASDLWIITAGESISWPLENQITSGSWQVTGYNTGLLPHSVYFRFLLSLPGATAATQRPDIIDVADINALAPTGADAIGG